MNFRKILNILYDHKLFLFLIILPIILGALYIWYFGVNVVFWDQWELVYLIGKMNTGHLTFDSFFSQHNEHRIFFPKIIMLSLAYITHYNTIVEMYFSWAIAVVSFFLVFQMFKKDFGVSTSALMMFVPIAWLMFSFRQSENILWGWQIQIYLAVLGLILSIYMLEKSEKVDIRFFIAIAGGIVSSYSFANGLVVWFAGMIFLMLSKKKNKRSLLSVWIFFAILTFISYFYGFIRPAHHPDPLFALKNPLVGIEYFLAALGSPITYGKELAIIAGFLFLILTFITFFYIILNKNFLHKNAKWIALIGFSFFSAILMTIGRSGFGVEQGMSSRYVTFTQFNFIGLFCILLNLHNNSNNTKEKRKYFLILVSLIFLIISGIFIGYSGGIVSGENTHESRLGISYFLLGYNFTSDDILKNIYPAPATVRERAEILKKYNLNVFGEYESFLYDIKPKALPQQPFIDGAGRIDDTMKFIIFEYPIPNGTSIIEFEKNQIPENAILKFDIALDPQSWSRNKGDGVTFEIDIRENEVQKKIFSKYIDPKHNIEERKWNYFEVNLSTYGGKNATIIFSTLPGPNNDSRWDLAWWGEPRIEADKK